MRLAEGFVLRPLAGAGLLAALLMAGVPAPASAAPTGGTAGLGAPAAEVTEALRSHALRSLEGRSVTLPALHGEVVVLNFWASWCAPCRLELPRLDAMSHELAGHGARVLAVSIDEEPDNARRFVKAHALTMPVILDGPNGLARKLDLEHVPFTIVLDRDGAIAFATSRSDAGGVAELGAVVRRLLDGKPVAANGAAEGR